MKNKTNNRPYVLLKCAISLDGCLDNTSNQRLILSNQEDFERVDLERAACDAILVGAETVRKDNPSLRVKDKKLRKQREKKGLPSDPIKVTLTASGHLNPDSKFFSTGPGEKRVYCLPEVEVMLRNQLLERASVIALQHTSTLETLLADLRQTGVKRLLVEGGGKLLTQFLCAGVFDELQVSIAPFFVGEAMAPRMTRAGNFLNSASNPLILEKMEKLGAMVLLTYLRQ